MPSPGLALSCARLTATKGRSLSDESEYFLGRLRWLLELMLFLGKDEPCEHDALRLSIRTIHQHDNTEPNAQYLVVFHLT